MPVRSKKSSVVIADDHPLILDALTALLRKNRDFQLVARCRDGEDTLAATRLLVPDLLILNLGMPIKNGLEVLRELQNDKLATKVVLLTAAIEPAQLHEAIRLGARGLIMKDSPAGLILDALRRIRADDLWFDKDAVTAALAEGVAHTPQLGTTLLSRREQQVFRSAAEGLSNQRIAEQLLIAEGTVKIHLHNIYTKLGIDSRPVLIAMAHQRRLI